MIDLYCKKVPKSFKFVDVDSQLTAMRTSVSKRNHKIGQILFSTTLLK